MAIYRHGARTSTLTISNACWEFRAIRACGILEIHFVSGAAVVQTLGIGRPANTGSVAGGTVALGQAEDPNSAATTSGTVLTGWSTAPTAPSVFMDRWQFAASIGGGKIWTFPNRLRVPVNGSIVLWNITATQVSDVTVVFDD